MFQDLVEEVRDVLCEGPGLEAKKQRKLLKDQGKLKAAGAAIGQGGLVYPQGATRNAVQKHVRAVLKGGTTKAYHGAGMIGTFAAKPDRLANRAAMDKRQRRDDLKSKERDYSRPKLPDDRGQGYARDYAAKMRQAAAIKDIKAAKEKKFAAKTKRMSARWGRNWKDAATRAENNKLDWTRDKTKLANQTSRR